MSKRKSGASSSWAKVGGAAMEGFEDAEEGVSTSTPPEELSEEDRQQPGESDEDYQRRYYERKKDELSEKAKARWANNEGGYRDRGLERAKKKRSLKRARKADKVLEQRVREKKKKPRRTRPPRLVDLGEHNESEDGTWVYSSGAMALKVGKSPPTMRTWIEERVIPGYTYQASGRYWFSMAFMEAVLEAVKRVLRLDGRGKLDMLRRHVAEVLEEQGIHYTTFPERD